MIWFKRAVPLLALILLWFAHKGISAWIDSSQEARDQKIAHVSAQVWVASTKYRSDPKRYLEYRDSVLKANDLDNAAMKKYVSSIQQDADRQLQFSIFLSKGMDSLGKIEDSVRVLAAKQAKDSVPKPVQK